MVKIGPWTIESTHWNPLGQNCERCGAHLKEVWTCSVDPQHERLPDLGYKTKWEIGSTCGPTLIEVSEHVWKEKITNPQKRLKLVNRLDRLIQESNKESHTLPQHLIDYKAALIDGNVTDRNMKHIGNLMATHERILGLRK